MVNLVWECVGKTEHSTAVLRTRTIQLAMSAFSSATSTHVQIIAVEYDSSTTPMQAAAACQARTAAA
jgi:hypothetical protein